MKIVFHGDLDECQDVTRLIELLRTVLKGEEARALASLEVVMEDEAAA